MRLEATIYTAQQMHLPTAPQLALAGRSNVGKSSLINALAGHKHLAHISSTPGKTRSINLYSVHPQGFYLVDLPGYGYARASHAQREAWARLIHAYLTDNPHLRALIVVLDSRLPPQASDLDLVAYATQYAIPLLPVLTKADKAKLKERAQVAQRWQDLLGCPPLVVSSRTGLGIAALWRRIHEYAASQNTAAALTTPAQECHRTTPSLTPKQGESLCSTCSRND